MSRYALRALIACAACLLGVWTLGCDDLGEFKTDSGEVFRGEVIGSDSDPGAGSFIREGFASHTQMELTFDPERASVSPDEEVEPSKAKSPGKLSTYVCPSGRSSCKRSSRLSQDFDGAELQPIERLAHDALSEYSFPGGGRIRNYMFGVRFSSALPAGSASRHAMVFLSLMENGQIEVRVIAPSVLDSDDKTELLPALFGVFVLGRQDA